MDIFVSQNKINIDNLTATAIINTIPENYLSKPIQDFEKYYKTEWRWRFLDINNRQVAEISFAKSGKRFYFNNQGDWVERVLDPIFDQFVVGQYYYYTK